MRTPPIVPKAQLSDLSKNVAERISAMRERERKMFRRWRRLLWRGVLKRRRKQAQVQLVAPRGTTWASTAARHARCSTLTSSAHHCWKLHGRLIRPADPWMSAARDATWTSAVSRAQLHAMRAPLCGAPTVCGACLLRRRLLPPQVRVLPQSTVYFYDVVPHTRGFTSSVHASLSLTHFSLISHSSLSRSLASSPDRSLASCPNQAQPKPWSDSNRTNFRQTASRPTAPPGRAQARRGRS